MAHYAFLDENNIVTEVIVGKDEGEDGVDWEKWYGEFRGQRCLRTSYNTIGNVHYGSNGEPDGKLAFRKNYAGIGFLYRQDLDGFVPAKMYDSWILDENTCQWGAPVSYPTDGKPYVWNEETLSWVEIEIK